MHGKTSINKIQKRLSIHNEISTTIVVLSVQSSLNWYFSPCQNSAAATADESSKANKGIEGLISCFSKVI